MEAVDGLPQAATRVEIVDHGRAVKTEVPVAHRTRNSPPSLRVLLAARGSGAIGRPRGGRERLSAPVAPFTPFARGTEMAGVTRPLATADGRGFAIRRRLDGADVRTRFPRPGGRSTG